MTPFQWTVLTACMAAVATGGCADEPSPARYPSPPASLCPSGDTVDEHGNCPRPAPSQQPPPEPAPPAAAADAGAGPAPSTNAACVPLDDVAAAAARQLLAPLGQRHAPPGARPIGALLGGQCVAGQTLEADLTVRSGKCYTVVGVGLPPVEDLDLQLVSPVPVGGLQAPVLAEDKTDGSEAVLAGHPNCFKWVWPAAASIKLLVRVESGEGVVAAQAFES